MASQGDIATNVFATWSSGKTAMLGITLILLIASAEFLTLPLGLVFFLIIYIVPTIWKSPDDVDPIRGMMIPGTQPYKISSFITQMKGENRSHIFSPTTLFGFGPPEDDMMKDVQRSFMKPPTRLAAYWALCFGILLSFLDMLIHPYLYPIWGVSIIPSLVAQIISVVFFFGSFQALNVAHRYYTATSMMGVNQVPAVLLHKVQSTDPMNNDKPLRRSIITFLVAFAITTGVIIGVALLALSAKMSIPLNWIMISVIAVVAGLALGLFSMFRVLTEAYRREFEYQVERRRRWSDIWEYKGNKIPFCEMEVPVPDTDPTKPGFPAPPPEGPMEPPTVWVATFAYPMNGTYSDYSEEAEQIGAALPGKEMLTIAPIPKRDPNTGAAIPGTVSSEGFRIWWTSEVITLKDLLKDNASIPPEKKEIGVRALVLDRLAGLSSIKRCLMHSHSMMTTPDSKINIMKVTIVPPNGVTEDAFTSNIPKISQALGMPWVRAKRAVDSNGRSVIELYIGDGAPNSPGIEFPKGAAASRYRHKLLSVDWEYSFKVNKITSPSGSPSMMLSKQVTDTSDKIIFDLPAGVSFDIVEKRQKDLMTSSGNGYIEIHPGITGEKDLEPREKRELERYKKAVSSKSQFTAVVSPKDPLDKIFLFHKYYDRVITGREPGVAKMAWSPGVKADGSLANFSFEKDFAHLLIAGSSGSGKSVLIYSMIIQLMANNNPEDCQIWIIDPKVGFSPFQYIDSVTRYVDSWTPDENFFINVRDMLSDAALEMKRRNGIFRFAADPSNPIDKLAVARKEAIKRGANPDGSPNELMQPFLVIIIDECAMLFAGAADKETKELQAEILFYASKLARESRSAGIHICFATQYPTNASLPSIIRQQAGRIGLQTQDNVASQVIIDQPGLEKLTIKGSGMIQEGKQFFQFRGFLMDAPDMGETSMSDILTALPKRQPDPAIDGQRAVEAARESGDIVDGDGGTISPYVEIPEIDASVFGMWNETKAAKSMDVLTNQEKRTKAGVSDKAMAALKAMTDRMVNILGEEEFEDILDNDRMEDFIQAYMNSYNSSKKK